MTGAESRAILGDVKDGTFRRLYGGSPGGSVRLSTVAPQAGISPEAQEVSVRDYEGRLLLVRGVDDGTWIYSAEIVDIHGGGAPPPVEFIRTLFRVGSLGATVQGLKKPEEPEPKEGDPNKFSEGVKQETLLELQVANGIRVHRISYPPGAHTHWHWHEGEQALYALSGSGLVRQEGQPPLTLEEGRIIYVTPGVRHWHGAMPDGPFVHLAFTASGRTEWEDEVSEEDYGAGAREIGSRDG
jgi:quercetin dioxygenase-like cupin family protein